MAVAIPPNLQNNDNEDNVDHRRTYPAPTMATVGRLRESLRDTIEDSLS